MTIKRILVPTRIPSALRIYLKAYAKQHRDTLESSCETMLFLFLQQAPWRQGLRWRAPLTTHSDAGESQGWRQFNLPVTVELAARLESQANQLDISRSSVTYTGLFWFAKYICPPVTPL